MSTVFFIHLIMKTHFDINYLENATETLRAIAHPARIAMIDLLFKNKEMSVTDIFEKLGIEQAVASHHLRILKSKNIVAVKRQGKNSIYSLSNDDYYEIIHILEKTL